MQVVDAADDLDFPGIDGGGQNLRALLERGNVIADVLDDGVVEPVSRGFLRLSYRGLDLMHEIHDVSGLRLVVGNVFDRRTDRTTATVAENDDERCP
jgi:hypothetical protein